MAGLLAAALRGSSEVVEAEWKELDKPTEAEAERDETHTQTPPTTLEGAGGDEGGEYLECEDEY